jgi:hypothetical protein
LPSLEAVSTALASGVDCRESIGSFLPEILHQSPFVPHPLGFLRVSLGESAQGPLYLHCWPGHGGYLQSRDLRVHQHSVPLTSYLILGSILDVTYEWIDDSSGELQLLKQNRTADGPRMSKTNRAGSLAKVGARRISSGNAYSVSSDIFHESVVDWAEVVVTVCLFVGRSERHPLVVAPRNLLAAPDYAPTAVPMHEVADLRRRILAGLLASR